VNDRAKAANEVQIISAWPGQSNENNEKVPSRICYAEKPPNLEIKWGNQIKPNQKGRVYALMKLKLDERLKKSTQLKLLLALLSSNIEGLNLDSDDDDGPPDYPGKAPVEIVADYLTEVRKHVWKELGEQFERGLFESLRKELVVTVPAVWSERAKDLTLKAVQQANFMTDEVMLVTEPEAAAVYTLKTMLEGANRNALEVCDAFNTISRYTLTDYSIRSATISSSVTVVEGPSI
jgi:molecular chaperone DnaK (HSP70)